MKPWILILTITLLLVACDKETDTVTVVLDKPFTFVEDRHKQQGIRMWFEGRDELCFTVRSPEGSERAFCHSVSYFIPEDILMNDESVVFRDPHDKRSLYEIRVRDPDARQHLVEQIAAKWPKRQHH